MIKEEHLIRGASTKVLSCDAEADRNFDRSQDIPIVDAVISGPISYERVRLVFDSGCGLTQIDTGLIESSGYSASNAIRTMSVCGSVGDEVQGYVVGLESFKLTLVVAAYSI